MIGGLFIKGITIAKRTARVGRRPRDLHMSEWQRNITVSCSPQADSDSENSHRIECPITTHANQFFIYFFSVYSGGLGGKCLSDCHSMSPSKHPDTAILKGCCVAESVVLSSPRQMSVIISPCRRQVAQCGVVCNMSRPLLLELS